MYIHEEIKNWFSIIAVYVEDFNIMGTPEEHTKTVTYFEKEV